MNHIAETINELFDGGLPIKLTAYDGSVAGDKDSPFGMEILNPRGLASC